MPKFSKCRFLSKRIIRSLDTVRNRCCMSQHHLYRRSVHWEKIGHSCVSKKEETFAECIGIAAMLYFASRSFDASSTGLLLRRKIGKKILGSGMGFFCFIEMRERVDFDVGDSKSTRWNSWNGFRIASRFERSPDSAKRKPSIPSRMQTLQFLCFQLLSESGVLNVIKEKGKVAFFAHERLEKEKISIEVLNAFECGLFACSFGDGSGWIVLTDGTLSKKERSWIQSIADKLENEINVL